MKFTAQPCNAPGRTTTSDVAAFAVPGLRTPVQAVATASAVTSPESRRNRMVDSYRDGAIRHDLDDAPLRELTSRNKLAWLAPPGLVRSSWLDQSKLSPSVPTDVKDSLGRAVIF